MKLTKITTERIKKIKELILAGHRDWEIIHLVFGNENGHHTDTYYQIVKRIRKTLTK